MVPIVQEVEFIVQIVGFVTRVTRRVPHVDQELSRVRVARSFVFCEMSCRPLLIPFVIFHLAIVLSVLIRFTAFGYPFGIVKLFFHSLFLIRIWILVFNATLSNISATSFSGGGSRSTQREPPLMGKQLANFITCGCKSSAPLFVIYKAGREPTPYWW